MAFGKGKLLYLIFLGRFPGYVSGFRSGWFLVLLEYSVGWLETLRLCWSRQGFLVQSLAESIHSKGVRFRLELHIRAALYGALRLRNITTDSFSARRERATTGPGGLVCRVLRLDPSLGSRRCNGCVVMRGMDHSWTNHGHIASNSLLVRMLSSHGAPVRPSSGRKVSRPTLSLIEFNIRDLPNPLSPATDRIENDG
jgi:hypothetical protein